MLITMLETRLLRYFVTVAKALHFGQAAAELGISQPALSQQIKQLEARLGVTLLHRTRHEVALTMTGKVFLEEAQRALDQIEHAERAAQRAAQGEVGTLSVGFVGSVMYHFLPGTVRLFRERYPGVELSLRELNSAEQVEALLRDQIDLGLLYGPVPEADIELQGVLRTPLQIAIPITHPLAGQEYVSLKALAQAPFVLVSREYEPGLHDRYIGLFQEAGVVPRVVQRANQIQTILGLVASGIGLFPVPGHVCQIRHEGMVYVPVQEEGEALAPVIELSAAWRRGEQLPCLMPFLNLIHEAVAAKTG